MCGIAGYIGNNKLDDALIAETLGLMKNRGPDYHSFRKYQCGSTFVYLLHSRLSIIDLDPRSNQPFTIGNYTIIFNGEIYNYPELRNELENAGVAFATTSDTEVLLASYIQYGEDCVNKFEGMWSFAIYNSSNGNLFLSRDRFGEKPLYYLRDNQGFFFGSEIKYLQQLSSRKFTINSRQLMRYLVNGYKSLYKFRETFFEDITELPYATSLTINTELNLNFSKYWKPGCSINESMTVEDAIEGTKERLLESMRLRLRSDVPLAFCLSGGVDSAVLASIAAKVFNYNVASFSIIDSDERYNEFDNIMATINDIDCRHTLINTEQNGALNRLRNLISYHDAPLATISYHIHSQLSEAMSQNGFKVAFSGTSADELFTGYYDHYLLHLYEMYNHKDYATSLADWQRHVAPSVRNELLKNPLLYVNNPQFRDHIYDDSSLFKNFLVKDFNENFTEEQFCPSLLRNRMLNELFAEATPVILHEDDLNSMLYSVENRSPYLDSRLFSFAYSIPHEHLIKDGYNKYILRQAMEGILNEKVRTDRQKKGFNASIYSLIDFDDKQTKDFLLADSPVYEFIDKEKIRQVFDEKPSQNSYSKFLFNFINAKIFLEMNA
ncbi:MAG: asparagine synthase (glutamine-hydrolyzing) [Smithellaceae bacterium]